MADLQQTETESETTKDVIVETDAQPALTGTLQENDGRVLTVMTSYYSARTNGDTETLKKLDPSLTDQELTELTDGYVENTRISGLIPCRDGQQESMWCMSVTTERS